jgi:hypothetical protein
MKMTLPCPAPIVLAKMQASFDQEDADGQEVI